MSITENPLSHAGLRGLLMIEWEIADFLTAGRRFGAFFCEFHVKPGWVKGQRRRTMGVEIAKTHVTKTLPLGVGVDVPPF